MKNKLILFTLMLALIISMVTVPSAGKASAATLPTNDYMMLADAVYESTKSTTLATELAKAQSRKGLKSSETFNDKEEKRMRGSWVKISSMDKSWTDFKSASYYNPTRNELVIAYAGTDSIYKDWARGTGSVSSLMTAAPHKQKPHAITFAKDTIKLIGTKKYRNPKDGDSETIKSNAKIIMTGHSLGGYLVQVAGIELLSNTSTAGKFKAGFTFNPLGVKDVDLSTKQWSNNKKGHYKKFAHFRLDWEIANEYNKASGRILAGDPNAGDVRRVNKKWSDNKYNHRLEGMYYYYNQKR